MNLNIVALKMKVYCNCNLGVAIRRGGRIYFNAELMAAD